MELCGGAVEVVAEEEVAPPPLSKWGLIHIHPVLSLIRTEVHTPPLQAGRRIPTHRSCNKEGGFPPHPLSKGGIRIPATSRKSGIQLQRIRPLDLADLTEGDDAWLVPPRPLASG